MVKAHIKQKKSVYMIFLQGILMDSCLLLDLKMLIVLIDWSYYLNIFVYGMF